MARRFKIPVFSRLTWAWIIFAGLGAGGVFYAASDGGKTRAAVAMAVDGIERFAPPPRRAADDRKPERLAAAAPEEPYGADAEDALGGGEAILAEDPAADILITVDGAPARSIGATARREAARATAIAAPDAALLRRSAYGQIPRVAADGRRPSEAYAQAFQPGDAPPVALIVGGLGLNRALTERAIDELPREVTLAFAPYAKDLLFWTKRARDAGHEIMVEIPMENGGGDVDALGPAALLTSRTDLENARRLDWILSRFPGYFGVTNYLGAKFSADDAAMAALLSRIEAAGLSYVDDTRAVKDAPAVDRLIDPGYGDNGGATKRDLAALEKTAGREGSALGKTYVHDATLDDVTAWALSLETKGLTLAPASAVLALRSQSR